MAGLKRSNAYLINGVVIFVAWLVRKSTLYCTAIVYNANL